MGDFVRNLEPIANERIVRKRSNTQNSGTYQLTKPIAL